MFEQLDGFDHKLLMALAVGDLTNSQLAARVGLSESQCYRRRARLEEAGAIQGYRARIDPRALGLNVSAYVHLNMASQSKHQRRAFATYINRYENVLSCRAVTGDTDYVLYVVVHDLSGLNELVNKILAYTGDRMSVRSLVVLETIKET